MSFASGQYLFLLGGSRINDGVCLDVLDRATLSPLGSCSLLYTSEPWERPRLRRLVIDGQVDLPTIRCACIRQFNDAALLTLDDGTLIDTGIPSPLAEALYRIALPKAAPMIEASKSQGCFWEKSSDDFAYVLNFHPRCDGLLVEAGFVFPASTAEAWEYLADVGCTDTSIRLRIIRHVTTEAELHAALSAADALRNEWFDKPREAVKRHIAEKQKAFLQRITAQLKPLGFRKKAANWTFQRSDGYEVVWNAQKSAYSDGYYFNLYLHRVGMREVYGCLSTRPMGALLDWQSIPEADFDDLLRAVIERNIRPMATLPLEEITRHPDLFGEPDICSPRRCTDCWYPENHTR